MIKKGFAQTSQQILLFIFFAFCWSRRKIWPMPMMRYIIIMIEGKRRVTMWCGTLLEYLQDVSTQISCWELHSYRYFFYLLESSWFRNSRSPTTILVNPKNQYEFIQIPQDFHIFFGLLESWVNVCAGCIANYIAALAASSAARTSDRTFKISWSLHFAGMA